MRWLQLQCTFSLILCAEHHGSYDVQASQIVSQCRQDALDAYLARRTSLIETSASQVSTAFPLQLAVLCESRIACLHCMRSLMLVKMANPGLDLDAAVRDTLHRASS